MRLKKLQAYLRDKGQEYQYTEEDGCGRFSWVYSLSSQHYGDGSFGKITV